MTHERAPLARWGALLVIGLAASFAPVTWQFGFCAVGIGLLGLPHGASDLAIVPPGSRSLFLAAYLVCIAAMALLWRYDAVLGLGSLLLLSAVHFSLDGDAAAGRIGRLALGGLLVGGPVLLHRAEVAELFTDVTGSVDGAAALARAAQIAGVVAVAMLATSVVGGRSFRGDALRPAAVAATVMLPPLVGFTIGFVLLHAREQMVERQRAIGCSSTSSYLVRVAPLMVGALLVIVLLALIVGEGHAGRAWLLFAAIAALATPHMLVTPLWAGRQSPSRVTLAATGSLARAEAGR